MKSNWKITQGDKILIVENEGSIATGIEMTLERRNIEVKRCRTSQEALELLASTDPNQFAALHINDRNDVAPTPLNSPDGLDTLSRCPNFLAAVSNRVVMSINVPWKALRRKLRDLEKQNPDANVVFIDPIEEYHFWNAVCGEEELDLIPGTLDPDSEDFDRTI